MAEECTRRAETLPVRAAGLMVTAAAEERTTNSKCCLEGGYPDPSFPEAGRPEGSQPERYREDNHGLGLVDETKIYGQKTKSYLRKRVGDI